VSILVRLGHEVIFPSGQACCGQMFVNSGYFKEEGAAVAPSGSCVAFVLAPSTP
jgi:L-lactate dehydrogenase complex protein LldE